MARDQSAADALALSAAFRPLAVADIRHSLGAMPGLVRAGDSRDWS